MALSKVIYSDSNEQLVQAAYQMGQPMLSLIEYDRGVKSAASDLISKQLLEEYRPTDSKTACIHLIAMGDAEHYGFNRNGDAFPEDSLVKYAHTFVKCGHVFSEHRNKDPKKALGSIKHAAYDKNGMHRVELIIHLDKDKAPEAFAMAKEGRALNFSMSCRVPNDRCSCCGNEAKTVNDYCDHLKYHMGKWQEKCANWAFAYNDKPTFFDISIVKHPADRIARHLEYSFSKEASTQGEAFVPSAIAAKNEGINLNTFDIDELSMLSRLTSSEEYVSNIKSASDNRSYACKHAYVNALTEKLSQEEINTLREANAGTVFYNMAKNASMLSFPAFCQYITGKEDIVDSAVVKKASLMLPDVFRTLFTDKLTMVPITDEFKASSRFMSSTDSKNDTVQNIMDKAQDKFSIEPDKATKRIIRITITCGKSNNKDKDFDKEAANVSEQQCRELASAYGQYQLRALCDMQDINGSDSITANTLDLITSANTAGFGLFD